MGQIEFECSGWTTVKTRRAKAAAGIHTCEKTPSIIPTRNYINRYDCEAIIFSIAVRVVSSAPVPPRVTGTAEKVYGWTSIESRAAKRALRSLARAEPWGPTLGGILKSNNASLSSSATSSQILSIAVPAVKYNPQLMEDFGDLGFENREYHFSKRCWLGNSSKHRDQRKKENMKSKRNRSGKLMLNDSGRDGNIDISGFL
ncbi:hypothetical protein SBOR_1603 [Sclerotinia borealis F-4128]|uniref:Uncharacterized protein n=1 Tax=Sclerotinia borealis (strain F-4128) TaxID=1432307 RepID=W9CU04_SCLBF|nr:hypothetical protein SBOR_1603 [Sclerotinia borealis F-4128]